MEELKLGYVCHIKDEFFDMMNDEKLMQNKENGRSRPAYYFAEDSETSLIWVIPMSTKVDKFREVQKRQERKYGSSMGVYIAKYDGKESVFLIQNMYPVMPSYISHIHTRNGNPIPVSHKTMKEVNKRAKKALALYKRGCNTLFADIEHIKATMLDEASEEQIIYDDYEDEYSPKR